MGQIPEGEIHFSSFILSCDLMIAIYLGIDSWLFKVVVEVVVVVLVVVDLFTFHHWFAYFISWVHCSLDFLVFKFF